MVVRKQIRWLGTAVIIAVALVMVIRRGTSMPSAPATRPPVQALPPAAQLRIQVSEAPAGGKPLLNPDAVAWKQAAPTAIILNRTPRIYQTEPVQDRTLPACQVRALRSGNRLWLRLQWNDATKNAPEAPPAMTGEAGDPKLLYKRPTGETASFADAAAVMVPDHWTGPAFPSLLMGDKQAPATLYYWNASRGGKVLTASGRATPQPSGKSFPYQARHADSAWIVTMELPWQAEGYPVAFAIWDGAFADRDGLKFFSVWHVLTMQGDRK